MQRLALVMIPVANPLSVSTPFLALSHRPGLLLHDSSTGADDSAKQLLRAPCLDLSQDTLPRQPSL